MQAQDSTAPSGVSSNLADERAGPTRTLHAARHRKADAAVSLRLAGASWSEIATTLGFPTPRQALVATERALARQLVQVEDREKMRAMAGARLERLLRSTWPKAIDPENPDQLVAVSKAREVIADHRKLFGLDAPAEFIVHSPTQSEIERWVSSILTSQAPPVEEYDIISGQVVPEALEQ